jgi:hypothetical protein
MWCSWSSMDALENAELADSNVESNPDPMVVE